MTTVDDTTPPTDEARAGDCSAGRLSEDVPEPAGLPATVAMMRKEILKAAVRCDYDLLERLALRGDGTFQYSFGQSGPQGAARYWRQREAEGEEVTALMVKLLALPYASRTVNEGPGTGSADRYYSFPSADQEHRDEADWEALAAVYGQDEIASWREHDLYTGYRLGISSDGDWMYFVAGD